MITGRMPRQRGDAARQRHLALDRLLDEEGGGAELLQRRLGLHRFPEVDDRVDVLVLLVAVEGDAQPLGHRVEHAGDLHQPLDVGLAVAADLELEAALAVGGDHFLERLGQAVADARARRLVGGDDRVDQPDRVPGGDAAHRLEVGEEGGEVEGAQVGNQRMRAPCRRGCCASPSRSWRPTIRQTASITARSSRALP